MSCQSAAAIKPTRADEFGSANYRPAIHMPTIVIVA